MSTHLAASHYLKPSAVSSCAGIFNNFPWNSADMSWMGKEKTFWWVLYIILFQVLCVVLYQDRKPEKFLGLQQLREEEHLYILMLVIGRVDGKEELPWGGRCWQELNVYSSLNPASILLWILSLLPADRMLSFFSAHSALKWGGKWGICHEALNDKWVWRFMRKLDGSQ